MVGEIIQGTVRRVVEFGTFVDVGAPVDGLVLKSASVKKKPEVNSKLLVMVKRIEKKERNSKIHLTGFLPGIRVRGKFAHEFANRGSFIDVGWYKAALLTNARMVSAKNSPRKAGTIIKDLYILKNGQVRRKGAGANNNAPCLIRYARPNWTESACWSRLNSPWRPWGWSRHA